MTEPNLPASYLRLRFVFAAIAFLVFVSAIAATNQKVAGRILMLSILVLTAPYIAGVVVSFLPRRMSATAGMAIGYGILGIPALVILILLAMIAAAFGGKGEGWYALLLLAIPLHIWLLVDGIVLSRATREGPSVVGTAIAAPAAVIFWYVFSISALQSYIQTSAAADRSNHEHALLAVQRAQVCLLNYAAERGEGVFPASLTDVAGRPDCPTKNKWEAFGHTFTYTPGSTTAPVTSFVIKGMPHDDYRDGAGLIGVSADSRGMLLPHESGQRARADLSLHSALPQQR